MWTPAGQVATSTREPPEPLLQVDLCQDRATSTPGGPETIGGGRCRSARTAGAAGEDGPCNGTRCTERLAGRRQASRTAATDSISTSWS